MAAAGCNDGFTRLYKELSPTVALRVSSLTLSSSSHARSAAGQLHSSTWTNSVITTPSYVSACAHKLPCHPRAPCVVGPVCLRAGRCWLHDGTSVGWSAQQGRVAGACVCVHIWRKRKRTSFCGQQSCRPHGLHSVLVVASSCFGPEQCAWTSQSARDNWVNPSQLECFRQDEFMRRRYTMCCQFRGQVCNRLGSYPRCWLHFTSFLVP